jgi:hypothetical protein
VPGMLCAMCQARGRDIKPTRNVGTEVVVVVGRGRCPPPYFN